MSSKTGELKDRVEAKKHELRARLAQRKAGARTDAGDAYTSVKKKLDELEGHLKDGWDKVGDKVSAKLNEWLKN